MSKKKTAYELWLGMPLATRDAAMRLASTEIAALLQDAHLAVGFPKAKGWSPVLAHSLEAVRKKFESMNSSDRKRSMIPDRVDI